MNSTKTSGGSPARKKTGPVTLVLAILALLVIGGGAGWYVWLRPAQSQAPARRVSAIRTAAVERGDIRLTASGSGTLVTAEAVNMSFSTSGKVAELRVKLGDVVKTGDLLARLDNPQDLEANLATAQANLLAAQQALAALQKSSGSALANAYKDLTTAQAAYNKAQAASQLAASTARCSPEMLAKYRSALDAAAGKLNDLARTAPGSDAYTIARYDYDTALANATYCASYTPVEKTSAQSSLEVAKAALQQAQDQYNTLKKASGIDPDTLALDETKVETAQTQVSAAQQALDGITLKAPMDGKVTFLAASQGAMVDTSTFLTLSDVSHPTVTVSLDETDMDKLVVGNSAVVTFSALPGKTFTGKVSVANPQMNSFGQFRAATGQVTLDADAAKVLADVPLGLSAAVTINGPAAKNVLLVPVSALRALDSGGYAVMLVGDGGKVTQQVVSVGLQDKTNAEITGGLQEGSVVRILTTSSSGSNAANNQGGGFFIEGGGGLPPGR